MKNLLTKTLRPFALYTLIVLTASIPAYYWIVDTIWLGELDGHNEIVAQRTEHELNKLKLSAIELERSVALWNKIQPGTNLQRIDPSAIKPDSLYNIYRYSEIEKLDRFQCLQKTIYIQGIPHRLTIETNVEETEETVGAIALITFLYFLILIAGFILLNRYLSIQLWKPFRSNLKKLQSFKLNTQTPISFDESDTLEFEELNQALGKLIHQNIAVYKTQKEFTENASHELQTPLAIIKNKLDVLLQKENVTERQYAIVEDINRAVTRMARINKNLLLLAKIEHRQFENDERLDLSSMTEECIQSLNEHAEMKGIQVKQNLTPHVIQNGNTVLVYQLLNNLLINAIRHTENMGVIRVVLSHDQLSIINSGTTSLPEEKLFQRFAKLSGEKTGSGLGLAIVKEICSQCDWDISYEHKNAFHHFSIRFHPANE